MPRNYADQRHRNISGIHSTRHTGQRSVVTRIWRYESDGYRGIGGSMETKEQTRRRRKRIAAGPIICGITEGITANQDGRDDAPGDSENNSRGDLHDTKSYAKSIQRLVQTPKAFRLMTKSLGKTHMSILVQLRTRSHPAPSASLPH